MKNIAIILLLVGSIGGAVMHTGAVTPCVTAVLDTIKVPGADEMQEVWPIRRAEYSEDQVGERQDVLMNIFAAAKKFPLYILFLLLWTAGLALFHLVRFRSRVEPLKVIPISAAVLLALGARQQFEAVRGMIMAFDTMGLSGGAHPDTLTMNTGLVMRMSLIGWVSFLIGGVVLVFAWLRPS